MSSYERTGFRDESISRRHRQWGLEATATDIDFLLIEYRADSHQPRALIDYKHESRNIKTFDDSATIAQSVLATKAGIPFFIVRYTYDFCNLKVFPRNLIALKFIPRDGETMDEDEFVRFLYRLRDLPYPKKGSK